MSCGQVEVAVDAAKARQAVGPCGSSHLSGLHQRLHVDHVQLVVVLEKQHLQLRLDCGVHHSLGADWHPALAALLGHGCWALQDKLHSLHTRTDNLYAIELHDMENNTFLHASAAV